MSLFKRDPLDPDDGLDPSRGIIVGLLIGLMFWTIVTFPYWKRFLPNG